MAHLVEGFGEVEDADISLESELHVVCYLIHHFKQLCLARSTRTYAMLQWIQDIMMFGMIHE